MYQESANNNHSCKNKESTIENEEFIDIESEEPDLGSEESNTIFARNQNVGQPHIEVQQMDISFRHEQNSRRPLHTRNIDTPFIRNHNVGQPRTEVQNRNVDTPFIRNQNVGQPHTKVQNQKIDSLFRRNQNAGQPLPYFGEWDDPPTYPCFGEWDDPTAAVDRYTAIFNKVRDEGKRGDMSNSHGKDDLNHKPVSDRGKPQAKKWFCCMKPDYAES